MPLVSLNSRFDDLSKKKFKIGVPLQSITAAESSLYIS